MQTERFTARTHNGRSIAVWRSTDDSRTDGSVVVLSPGFGRRMRDLAAMAACLCKNGAVVYRFDSSDHIGLSDGDVENFCVSSLLDSMRATIALAREKERRERLRLMALSLSAIPALEIAAADRDIDRVVAVSGVLNGVATIARVTGTDLSTAGYDDLPATIDVLGLTVNPRALWSDHRETGCLSVERTLQHLTATGAAVANCVATDDPWVDADETEALFARGTGGERMIIRLPYTGHDLGRNPVAVLAMFRRLSYLGAMDGPFVPEPSADIRMPDFDDLLGIRIDERGREQRERREREPVP